MANKQDNNTTETGSAGASLRDGARQEMEGVRHAFGEVRDDLVDRAADLASEAGDALRGKAEGLSRGLGAELGAYGEAMRAASEHLSRNRRGEASRMIDQAAGGLERFAQSLEHKSLGEVVEEMRALGRSNAGGLFAGSMLAGLALGRLFRASEPATSEPSASPAAGSTVNAGNDIPPAPTATSGYAS